MCTEMPDSVHNSKTPGEYLKSVDPSLLCVFVYVRRTAHSVSCW